MDLSDVLASTDSELVPEILPVGKRLHFSGTGSVLLQFFRSVSTVCSEDVTTEQSRYAYLSAVSLFDTHRLYISARSSELTISTLSEDVTVHVAGDVVVPAKKIIEVLEVAKKSAEVTFSVVDDKMIITAGRAIWNLALPDVPQNKAAYEVPSASTEDSIEVHTEDLLKALRGALSVCGKGVSRMSLHQLLIKNGNVIGSDGKRLHLYEVPELAVYTSDLTIPNDGAAEMVKVLEKTEDTKVNLYLSKKKIFLENSTTKIIVSPFLIPYPDISSMLLTAQMTTSETVMATKKDLIEAISSVRVTANQDYSTLSMAVVPKAVTVSGHQEWNLVLSSKVLRGHQGSHVIPVSYVDGEAQGRTVIVNYKHVLTVLENVKTDFVRFHLGPDTATVKAPLYFTSTKFSALIPQTDQVF